MDAPDMLSTRATFAALAGCLALGLAGPAVAATTLGQSGPGVQADSCQSGSEFIQRSRIDGTSYAAPADGVLTSWTFQAGTQLTQLALRVYRASGYNYTTVAEHGTLEAFLPNTARTIPTRLAVRAGDLIGVRVVRGGCAIESGSQGDVLLFNPGPLTAVGGSAAYGSGPTGFALEVAAKFELDTDGDGYGDESQDLCPQSAKTQAACPAPNTKVKRAKTNRAQTRIVFSASIAGSTFACSLDGKKAHPCHPPATYRCLTPGKHIFSVAATSPLGIVDPSPAARKFTVSDRHDGC
jgi:hypothetical protein